MQRIRQRLLWTQEWLLGIPETRTPSEEREYPSDDAQPPATETDSSFEIISYKNNEDALNNDFGILSISDTEPPTKDLQDLQDLQDLPQPPPSHCRSCGYPFPPSPPSTSSEPIPPQQPTQNLELAGRGDHSHVFGDLRSPSLARQRELSAREKYYGIRYVKRGELGSEGVIEGMCSCSCCGVEDGGKNKHIDGDDDNKKSENASSCAGTTTISCNMERRLPQSSITTADPPPPPTKKIDKHTLYKLAQLYPRPPRNHHRHIDKVRAPLSQRVDRRRKERKHQRAILRDELEDQ